jgi:hypothetical protein
VKEQPDPLQFGWLMIDRSPAASVIVPSRDSTICIMRYFCQEQPRDSIAPVAFSFVKIARLLILDAF